MTKFSVNLNKFALLRNSRGANRPDVLAIAHRCLAAGVHGITVHPRPDQRHTRDEDVRALAELLREWPDAELNIEGNPTPRYLQLVLDVRPQQATLVPDADNQLTSDHGWNVRADGERLAEVVAKLQAAGIRTSLFMDPDVEQMDAVAETGAERIELYTEAYARGGAAGELAPGLKPYVAAARKAESLGLGVNAGHDLDLTNLGPFLDAIPSVLEVSIGHAFVCESFDFTLEGTVDRYLAIVGMIRGSVATRSRR